MGLSISDCIFEFHVSGLPIIQMLKGLDQSLLSYYHLNNCATCGRSGTSLKCWYHEVIYCENYLIFLKSDV